MAFNLDSLKTSEISSTEKLNLKMLEPLDEALRCRICFEYFTSCMVTKCSHNYCSACIRRYMMYKTQCPTCFQEATEPELRSNRLIDEVLSIYTKIREDLMQASEPQSDSSTEDYKFPPSISIEIKQEPSTSEQCDKLEIKNERSPNEVACPVCYKQVFASRINAHLDVCLEAQTDFDGSTIEKVRIPKLVYHLLTEKEIKRKLKEHGLSVSGDKQTLIRRHKNFRVLYNSNCDSLNPRPISDLIQELEMLELEERIDKSPNADRNKINKKSDLREIEKHNLSYVKRHQSHFNQLMQNIHQRQIDSSPGMSYMDTRKYKIKKEAGVSDSEDEDSFEDIHLKPPGKIKTEPLSSDES